MDSEHEEKIGEEKDKEKKLISRTRMHHAQRERSMQTWFQFDFFLSWHWRENEKEK